MRLLMYVVVVAMMVGCDSDQTTSTMHQRQDDALRDPMNYSPHVSDRTNISGGGITDFKKDAFKRDVDSVFNP